MRALYWVTCLVFSILSGILNYHYDSNYAWEVWLAAAFVIAAMGEEK